jgi:hypothetical protein
LTLIRRRMKATLASGFAHATSGSPPFSYFVIPSEVEEPR